MEIVKFKKIGKSKYKVYFENQELILYEDVILKYNLLVNKNIKLDLLEEILECNKYYEMYNLALNYVSIKMRSEKEIREYLIKKDASINDIDKIIEDFKIKGLINNNLYITSFINDSINLKEIGPNKIKNELIKLGFEEYDIELKLSKIDNEIWESKINKYIKKHINKSISTNMMKLKLLNDLKLKGYSEEMVYPLLDGISLEDDKNIKLEYDKAYKKYSNKYKDRELNNKIINYLMRKGYNYSDITKILN